tara:strand:+ start:49 stop:1122 length:1074 start_codon:yes stop_codon:yes gene_type:complete
MNFSLYDGAVWHPISGTTEITEDWYYFAAVVDGSEATLYLDAQPEGELKLQKKMVLGTCHEVPCLTDAKMSISTNNIIVGAYAEHRVTTNQYGQIVPNDKVHSYFSGLVSSVEVFSGAFTEKQISKLYEKNKHLYKKDVTLDSASVAAKSPALSDSECLDLVGQRGLEGKLTGTYTLICQFPFDVIIPLNSDVIWVETLPLDGGPYHSIRSVDNLFRSGITSFNSMGFYEPTFTYGVYEYFDELNKPLTGKIIISESTNTVTISRNSSSPKCGMIYSCFVPFAVNVGIGETVIWKNTDTTTHTVTTGTPGDGPDGLFDTGLMETVLAYSHTFSEAGTYDYYCLIHPWMQGKVIVGEI